MMKMKKNYFFPLVEPRTEFREKLKHEILEVYNQQQKPRFYLRWLVAPSIAVASLLLVINYSSSLSSIVEPNSLRQDQTEILESNQPSQQVEQSNDMGLIEESNQQEKQVELADINLDFSQVEKELVELSQTLDTDTDLDSAIAFRNL